MNHALGLKQVCALILNSLLPHTARNELWILDFEATDRMTPNLRVFETYKPIISSRKITLANGHTFPIVGQGKVYLNHVFQVQHVLYVPSLSTNLLSVHKLTQDLNCRVIFSPHDCVF